MAAIVWQNVISIAPELCDLAKAAQECLLEWVNAALDPTCWGGEDSAKLKLARMYLAAHFGATTFQGQGQEAGPVTSETAGDLTRQYATMRLTGGSAFASTAYGRLFWQLTRSTPNRICVV